MTNPNGVLTGKQKRVLTISNESALAKKEDERSNYDSFPTPASLVHRLQMD
jgi:hypothetical protein